MLKSTIKGLLPHYAYILYRTSLPVVKKQGGFYGQFKSWQEAKLKSRGYQLPLILEKVLSSANKAKSNPDLFERDGVLDSSKNYSYPLIAYLKRWHMLSSSLSVLDFGGSLGSSYFQFRKFFPMLSGLTWSVIEQANYVEVGRKNFQSELLYFYDTIDQCIAHQTPNVALISSTLQYLEKPYEVLDEIIKTNVRYLVVDRLPVMNNARDTITIQYVPKSIYDATYPAWLFSQDNLINYLSKKFDLIYEFETLDGRTYLNLQPVTFKGFILERKP